MTEKQKRLLIEDIKNDEDNCRRIHPYPRYNMHKLQKDPEEKDFFKRCQAGYLGGIQQCTKHDNMQQQRILFHFFVAVKTALKEDGIETPDATKIWVRHLYHNVWILFYDDKMIAHIYAMKHPEKVYEYKTVIL